MSSPKSGDPSLTKFTYFFTQKVSGRKEKFVLKEIDNANVFTASRRQHYDVTRGS